MQQRDVAGEPAYYVVSAAICNTIPPHEHDLVSIRSQIAVYPFR